MHLHILLKSIAPSSVNTVLKQHNSGNLAFSGCIKWLGEPVRPQHATKMVREAEIVDPSGAINFSVWESHIRLKRKKFYIFTNCKLNQQFGKRLVTIVKQLPEHKPRIPMLSLHRANQILGVLCPEIMNIYPLFIQCAITMAVKKKISENPGSNIARCLHCNRAML